jgi:hypothetical protein
MKKPKTFTITFFAWKHSTETLSNFKRRSSSIRIKIQPLPCCRGWEGDPCPAAPNREVPREVRVDASNGGQSKTRQNPQAGSEQ